MLGILVSSAVMSASFLAGGHNATGGVNNVAPSFSAPGSTPMTVTPSSVDNSGSDTIEFDATFLDANGDIDDEIVQVSCVLTVYEGPDNGGTQVTQWTGTWDSAPGATEFVLDPTGTTGDGYVFLADSAGDTDPGFLWTVPTTLNGSPEGAQHYVELVVEDDDGLTASTGANFDVYQAIQIEGIFQEDGVAFDVTAPYDWNFPDTDPGTSGVSSGDGTHEYWLVVRNAGSDPSDSFALTFIGDSFSSATTSEEIPIDGAIDFEYYEGTAAPGAGDDPDEQSSTTSAVDDVDGIWSNADFTAVDRYIWIRYEIDIPAISRDASDYTTAFTVAAD